MNTTYVDPCADSNVNDLKLTGFKVYEVGAPVGPALVYRRRDFYKVSLLVGQCTIYYADKVIELDGTYLLFTNPHIPYSFEHHGEPHSGYACLFTEEFVKATDRSESLQQSPLFKIGGTPIFMLTDEQAAYISGVFRKMLAEQSTDYLFRHDLIRTYIQLVIHEALRMQPAENFVKHQNAAARITALFLELLERLFPVESPEQVLPLKTAQDFANRLSIHVNHLNRAVKEITGKSTTAHIAERVVGEAKALLHHTDWDVAAIGYGLGFEYASYFNNFFKKHTGSTPLAFRRAV
ncbi:helix-turn-helix domain-containing protein [Hymenobacter norwichensis]|uniref:helix-turn-helix domain-containing protein n=1 Tax=Hymenobacter norwichensis TaxID=223903 RepID=UPI0003B48045|nr:helix-turn-helix domain-containing protein [Hymenobacter norwichensis]